MLRTANTNPTPYSSLVGIIWYKTAVTTSILEVFKRKVTVENFIKKKKDEKKMVDMDRSGVMCQKLKAVDSILSSCEIQTQ